MMRREGRGGRIINFTSQGFWSGGYGGSVAYAATKGGIVSMTRGLARSLAKDKITVNAVSPGAADTAMMRSGMTEEALRRRSRADPARLHGGTRRSSPAPCCSSPPTMPATSPARRSTSAAAG